MSAAACRSCGCPELEPFYRQVRIPVHSCLLLADREEALAYPRGDLELRLCRQCGFIQNSLHDPRLSAYSSRYEESQAYSPRFLRFAREQAALLVERYRLEGKEVLEIGCGQGEFLRLLCEMGRCHGLGMDPAYCPDRAGSDPGPGVRILAERFSAEHTGLEADLICCRHTLEHLPEVREFLLQVAAAASNRRGTVVCFEVPDVARVLEERAFWDIYYEHCSYFSLGSLARLFRSCGFRLLDLRTGFSGQYLMVEACLDSGADRTFPGESDGEELARRVWEFRRHVPAMVARWSRAARQRAEGGGRVVLWGAGSKAVGYLAALGLNGEIEYVVDINPHKQGMFLAGTGQRIVPPSFLEEYRPGTVIIMNPIYAVEIRRDLESRDLRPELLAV